jgi:fatty acid desaturase
MSIPTNVETEQRASYDGELGSVRAAMRGEVDRGPNEAARRAAAARAGISKGLEAELALLRAPRVSTRLGELAMFASIWALGGWIVMTGLRASSGVSQWTLRLVGTLVIALALHAVALLLHDGVHHTLLRNRVANRWLSVLLGACALMSASAYQAMHERHHIFLGDARDPDDYHNYSGDRRLVWVMHYVRLLFGSFLYIALIPVMVAKRAAPSEQRRVMQEYAVLAAIYAVLWMFVPHALLVHAWLLPIIPAGIMFNIRSLAAHGITDPSDPFLASRSIDAHPVVAFFFRNENYHLEHHLFPEIPSYNLKAVHRMVYPRMPHAATARSYVGFLRAFVRQSIRLDESPIGVTKPSEGGEVSRSASPDARINARSRT